MQHPLGTPEDIQRIREQRQEQRDQRAAERFYREELERDMGGLGG